MKIDSIKVGMLATNCYILTLNDNTIVIDPGDEFEQIKERLEGKKVIGIIITHYHFDHIGALDELNKYTNAKVYDFTNLEEGNYQIEDFEFKVIATPGHKEDLISIYFEKEKLLFCGDFIFEGTIGRCDLRGGDFGEMQKSIRKILEYPNNMTIYPGHGNVTTMQRERRNLEQYL